MSVDVAVHHEWQSLTIVGQPDFRPYQQYSSIDGEHSTIAGQIEQSATITGVIGRLKGAQIVGLEGCSLLTSGRSDE